MDDPIQLFSSMSPKIRVDRRNTRKLFNRGPTHLALKKHFRKSLDYEQVMEPKNNSGCIILNSSLESPNSSTTVSSTNKFVQKPICIEDSYSSGSSNHNFVNVRSNSRKIQNVEKQKQNVMRSDSDRNKELLSANKYFEIENWVLKVNSSNCDNVETNVIVERKHIDVANESEVSYEGFTKKFPLRYDVHSTLLESTCVSHDDIPTDKEVKLSLCSVNIGNDSNMNIRGPKSLIHENQNENLIDPKKKGLSHIGGSVNSIGNFIADSAVAFGGKTDEDGDEPPDQWLDQILGELYGDHWRCNKEDILTKSERKPKISKETVNCTNSERKPKQSITYKNPYLDVEKTKSNNLLRTLHTQRMRSNLESPWAQSIKKLCDSDTNSENSETRNITRTKLNFQTDDLDEDSSPDSNMFGGNLAPKNLPWKKSKPSKSTNNCKSAKDKETLSNIEVGHINSMNNIELNKKNLKYTKKKSKKLSSTEDENLSDFSISLEPLEDRIKKTLNIRENNEEESSNYIKQPNTKKGIHFRKESDQGHVLKKGIHTDSNCIDLTKKKSYRNPKKTYVASSSNSSEEDNVLPFVQVTSRTVNKENRNEHSKTYSFLSSLSDSVPILKCDMSARIYRNNFKNLRTELAKKLFNLYNENVFENKIPSETPLEWSERMTNTAGYCYCRKITRSTGNIERAARIVLSSKVLDRADRLRDTLIHEMCHAATWIVNQVTDGHGSFWKAWANKAMRKYPEIPPIRRCHEYVINRKYTYKCTQCDYSIGRSRKSIDIERKRCGYCYGKFELLINKINKNGEVKSVAATPKKEATGFALFVKENYADTKTPDLKHADVMKLLGQKFSTMKVKS